MGVLSDVMLWLEVVDGALEPDPLAEVLEAEVLMFCEAASGTSAFAVKCRAAASTIRATPTIKSVRAAAASWT